MKWKLPILLTAIFIALSASGVYIFTHNSTPNIIPTEIKTEEPLLSGTATIARVQYKHTYDGSTKTAAFTSNNTAGNFIIVFASGIDATTMSVADSQSNSYNSLEIISYSGTYLQAWYAMNINGGANTVTLTTGGSDLGLTAIEYSGVATTSALDGSPILMNYSSEGAITQSITTASFDASATGLIVMGWADNYEPKTGIAPNANYVSIQDDLAHYDGQAERLNVSTGSYTAGYTWTFVNEMATFISAVFKAATTADPPPPASATTQFNQLIFFSEE